VIEVLFLRHWSLLRYLEAFGRVITTACYELKPHSQPPLFQSFISYFSHSCCVATISLLSVSCTITLDGMGGWDEKGQDEES
jgi:hypothetical protein